MSQKVQTPKGKFNSIREAARYHAMWHGPEFIQEFPGHDYPYNKPHGGNYAKQICNSTEHYIYWVMLKNIFRSGVATPVGYKRLP